MIHQPIVSSISIRFLLLLLPVALSSCITSAQVLHHEIPAVPMAMLDRWQNRGRFRLPLAIHDEKLSIVGYSEDGDPALQMYDAATFPTDVWIVYKDEQLRAFLARSPHGGCLIFWDEDRAYFHDPCYGSKFTENGEYIEGPSTRNLDELPARIEGEMIWVSNDIIYGKPVN
ncbi:MAG: Rieske (2Fe-2S) protein [Caldilineaceae bacterium]|nr:Rieske (2Fe-2S) protein [Caldilineaceae bacterium]